MLKTLVSRWLLTTLWPHCDLLNSLMVCETILHRKQPFGCSSNKSTHAHVQVIPNRLVTSLEKREPSVPKLGSRKARIQKSLRVGQQALICLAGIGILAIHFHAQRVSELDGCAFHAGPWLNGHKSSCVVMKVNCYRHGIGGHDNEIRSILTHLNENALITLVFAHCPELTIPSIIRRFPNLDGIEIYNSTLQQWPLESSLRDRDSPVLKYLYFVRSHLGENASVPEALVQDDLPSSLSDILFFETKLVNLPPQVKDSWNQLMTLHIDSTHLETIPPVLFETQIPEVYLIDNPIHNVTLDLFASETINVLVLSGSSFTQLPDNSTGNPEQLSMLLLERTRLEQVPSYIQEWYLQSTQNGFHVLHSLFGSPFCTNSIANDEQEQTYQRKVCRRDLSVVEGKFPIEVVEPQREL